MSRSHNQKKKGRRFPCGADCYYCNPALGKADRARAVKKILKKEVNASVSNSLRGEPSFGPEY